MEVKCSEMVHFVMTFKGTLYCDKKTIWSRYVPSKYKPMENFSEDS